MGGPNEKLIVRKEQSINPLEGIPVLRRFQKGDEKAVYDLHIKALKDTGLLIEDPKLRNEWDKDLKNIEEEYTNNHGEFFVVTINDKIIGMGALRKVNETTGEIKRMRVEPTLQGKKIGSLIFDKLIERAKELEYKKLILDVAEEQKIGRLLYESRGFREYKRGELGGQKTVYYELDI